MAENPQPLNPQFLNLQLAQMNQIIEQYRVNMYNMELRFNLLLKMVEEKGMFVAGELDKRWPLFLKNDVGVPGPDGVMEGTLKTHLYSV